MAYDRSDAFPSVEMLVANQSWNYLLARLRHKVSQVLIRTLLLLAKLQDELESSLLVELFPALRIVIWLRSVSTACRCREAKHRLAMTFRYWCRCRVQLGHLGRERAAVGRGRSAARGEVKEICYEKGLARVVCEVAVAKRSRAECGHGVVDGIE